MDTVNNYGQISKSDSHIVKELVQRILWSFGSKYTSVFFRFEEHCKALAIPEATQVQIRSRKGRLITEMVLVVVFRAISWKGWTVNCPVWQDPWPFKNFSVWAHLLDFKNEWIEATPNYPINFRMSEENLTELGFEPEASGLTCKRSYQLSYQALY